MTPAESLPPLDAGYYLATHPDGHPPQLVRRTPAGWWRHGDETVACPRVFGWTLTPVAAIEKLAEERDQARRAYADEVQRCCTAWDEQRIASEERDKALADLVAVRAERDRIEDAAVELQRERESDWGRIVRDRDAARAELARVREALELYRSVADTAEGQWSDDYLWEKWGLSGLLAKARVLAATPPTRSAE